MANLYDLKKFDLNLLVIFECIGDAANLLI